MRVFRGRDATPGAVSILRGPGPGEFWLTVAWSSCSFCRVSFTIRYQEEDHELHAGDSVLLDCSEPHSYHGSGKKAARAVVVTTPLRI
jgi:hypothetical protein